MTPYKIVQCNHTIRPATGREHVVVITGWSDERGCKTKVMTGLSIRSGHKKVLVMRCSHKAALHCNLITTLAVISKTTRNCDITYLS